MKTASIPSLALLWSWSWGLVAAHTVLTYPGWRGNNLIDNETFPYGMQWMYPCGGMPLSQNRTKWPIDGGAVAVQPGWFTGHHTAFFYVNMGLGNEPRNMSFPMLPVFQILGPSRDPYPGTFCLPQVPLPVNATVEVGDNATIQIIETAIHGAALFNCVDITFADPSEVAEVNETNCFNSSTIGFADVFTSTQSSAGARSMAGPASTTWTALLIATVAVLGAALHP